MTLLCATGLATLNKDIMLEALQAQARSQTDLAATQAMQQAKSNLFTTFEKPRRRA